MSGVTEAKTLCERWKVGSWLANILMNTQRNTHKVKELKVCCLREFLHDRRKGSRFLFTLPLCSPLGLLTMAFLDLSLSYQRVPGNQFIDIYMMPIAGKRYSVRSKRIASSTSRLL